MLGSLPRGFHVVENGRHLDWRRRVDVDVGDRRRRGRRLTRWNSGLFNWSIIFSSRDVELDRACLNKRVGAWRCGLHSVK